MKRIGISISKARLAAFAWEKTPFSGRALGACEVPCTEPFGSAEDIRTLASTLRSGLGGGSLPPAVLSLPPETCYLRVLELPVADLGQARLIHRAEIEGTLPTDDEDLVSDLLPMTSSRGTGGRYLAIAARRAVVGRIVEAFSAGGFQVAGVVADVVSLLCALPAESAPQPSVAASFESDVVLLSLSGRAVRAARQLPLSVLDAPERFAPEAVAFAEGAEAVLAAGSESPVETLFPGLPFTVLTPPGDLAGASLLAFGASQVPFSPRIAHGFSLAGKLRVVDDEGRRAARLRNVAVAAGIALASCVVSLEVARWTAARQVASVRKQLRTEFSAAVPEAKVVVRETTQLRERIAALRRQKAELGLDLPPVTPLLASISTALPSGKSLSVKEISIDGGRIRVAGESSAQGAVEGYRAALASSLGRAYRVTVQESRGSARGESVAFTILIEKGGESRAS